MSSSLNNFCESLVNGSNPRYTYSQPTIAQQVSWQVQKEQESFQAACISIAPPHVLLCRILFI